MRSYRATSQRRRDERPQTIALVDLDDAGQVAVWTTVNDPVMGGLSTSRITFDNGGLLFSGNISLENNGGFASARSPQNSDIGRRATGARSLRVHATGDGNTYVLKVGIEGQPWSYIQRFPTQAAVQRIYELPVGASNRLACVWIPHPTPRRLWTLQASTSFRSTFSTNSRPVRNHCQRDRRHILRTPGAGPISQHQTWRRFE